MIRGHLPDQIREIEAPVLAAGVPLMQHAAEALAASVAARLGPERRVLVLVGGGNNGGDGLFAAAALAATARVSVVLTNDVVHTGGLAAVRETDAELLDLLDGDIDSLDRVLASARRADVWVDALTGIGASGPLREPMRTLVTALGALGDTLERRPVVVAVDVPSGVDAASGAAPGPVLRADTTVTFVGVKAGLLLPPGAHAVGTIELHELGLGEQVDLHRHHVQRLETEDARALWPVPGPEDHKYTRGVVGVTAGSRTYPGAAVLTVGGALRTGAGMVRYLGDARPTELVLARWPEVVTAAGRVQSRVLGPGTDARDTDVAAALSEAFEEALAARVAVVADAGALAVLATLLADRGRLDGHRVVLTPHAGELARLLGELGESTERADVEADPLGHTARASELTGATVLLKGAVTLVVGAAGESRDRRVYAQKDATGWLATAGAGDVLAGVLGALLAGLPRTDAATVAALAALVHGRAARAASGGGPIVAEDVVAALPATIRELLVGE